MFVFFKRHRDMPNKTGPMLKSSMRTNPLTSKTQITVLTDLTGSFSDYQELLLRTLHSLWRRYCRTTSLQCSPP